MTTIRDALLARAEDLSPALLAGARVWTWQEYVARSSRRANVLAAPIERVLVRHPSIAQAAVYAVPDPSSGDQLVAALVLVGDLSPGDLEDFLAAQQELGSTSWPRFVRIVDELPRTATNKVLKRELQTQGLGDVSALWTRAERGTAYAAL